MHIKEGGRRVLETFVTTVRFLRRHKRWAVASLVVAPLLTGMGLELFV